MKSLSIVTLALLVALTAGCTTKVNKTLQPTGGSRADGMVEMSFEYTRYEEPQVQWEQAKATAGARCKAWGYDSAEPFGGAKTQCKLANGFGDCMQALVTINYQCISNDEIKK